MTADEQAICIESTSDVQEVGVPGELASCWSNLTVRVVPLSGAAATVRTVGAISILQSRSVTAHDRRQESAGVARGRVT